MQSIKVLRVFLLFSFFFCFISSVERKNIPFLSKKDLCPYFGDLSSRQIPWESTYFDKLSNERKVYVRTRSGQEKRLSEKTLRFARRIKTAKERDDYKYIYEEVCGGISPFWNLISYNQKEKLSLIQHRKKSFKNKKLSTSLKENSFGTKKNKQEILKKVDELKTSLDKVEPIHFQVMGKVLSEKGKDLVLFGSSIPQKASKLQVPGFVYNGLILLKNHKRGDIKSPEGYSVKHVQAVDLEYVKTIRSNSSIGENIPVYVFRHRKKSSSTPKIALLKKELEKNLNQLASLD